MVAALTMVPALMGLVRGNVRSLPDRIRARRARISIQRAGQADRGGHRGAPRAQRVRPLGPHGQPQPVAVGHRPAWLVLVVLAIPLFSIVLGQPDNGTNPTSQSNRRAYDLIKQGFGVGVNGPLTVVVALPKAVQLGHLLAAVDHAEERVRHLGRGLGRPGRGELRPATPRCST